jgi:hypothetical protein
VFHRVDDGKLGLECCLEGGVGDRVFLPLVQGTEPVLGVALQQGDCVLKTALVIIALHCLEVHVQGAKPGVNKLLIFAKGAFVRGGCLGKERKKGNAGWRV